MAEDLSAIFPAGVRIDSVSALLREIDAAKPEQADVWNAFIVEVAAHIAAVGLTVYNGAPAVVIVVTDPDSYAAAHAALVNMGKG
jgi:hypothetical protein